MVGGAIYQQFQLPLINKGANYSNLVHLLEKIYLW